MFTYDNDKSVHRLNLLQDFYGTADPTCTDYDVWAKMKSLASDVKRMTPKAVWVKGHQDDSIADEQLSFEAKENIAMDKKCEEMRESDSPTPPFPYFSIKKAKVIVSSTPITQQLQEYLHVYTTGPALISVVRQTGQMHNSRWSIGQHLINTSSNSQAQRRQLSSRCSMAGSLLRSKITSSNPRTRPMTQELHPLVDHSIAMKMIRNGTS